MHSSVKTRRGAPVFDNMPAQVTFCRLPCSSEGLQHIDRFPPRQTLIPAAPAPSDSLAALPVAVQGRGCRDDTDHQWAACRKAEEGSGIKVQLAEALPVLLNFV